LFDLLLEELDKPWSILIVGAHDALQDARDITLVLLIEFNEVFSLLVGLTVALSERFDILFGHLRVHDSIVLISTEPVR